MLVIISIILQQHIPKQLTPQCPGSNPLVTLDTFRWASPVKFHSHPLHRLGLNPALLVNAPWEKIINNMSVVSSMLINIIFLSLGCYRYNLGPACSKQRLSHWAISQVLQFFLKVLLCFETRSHFVTQYVVWAGSTVMAIFLPKAANCRDFRHRPPSLVYKILYVMSAYEQTRGPCQVRPSGAIHLPH